MEKPLSKALFVFLVLCNVLLIAYISFALHVREATEQAPSTTQDSLVEAPTYIAFPLPDSLDFAGEAVPLEQTLVQDRLDAVLISTVYRHANTILRFKRAARWFPQIEQILKENNIPDDFKYMALVESNLMNLISSQGATGFWQFMPETAREYGLEVNRQVDERYHPIKSTRAAVKYLRDAYRKFNNWTLVAASYNMGMAGLQRRMRQQKGTSYFDLHLNAETSAYIYHILVVKLLFEHPEAYGFHLEPEHLYKPYVFDSLEVNTSIPSLVDFAQEKNVSYSQLKTYNPWLRTGTLIQQGKPKTYTLLLPKSL